MCILTVLLNIGLLVIALILTIDEVGYMWRAPQCSRQISHHGC